MAKPAQSTKRWNASDDTSPTNTGSGSSQSAAGSASARRTIDLTLRSTTSPQHVERFLAALRALPHVDLAVLHGQVLVVGRDDSPMALAKILGTTTLSEVRAALERLVAHG